MTAVKANGYEVDGRNTISFLLLEQGIGFGDAKKNNKMMRPEEWQYCIGIKANYQLESGERSVY